MANANVNSDEELSNELAEGLSEILNITEFKVLKSSKKKDAVLHAGYYYNFKRKNKHSTVFKCRFVVDKAKKLECSGTFTLDRDKLDDDKYLNTFVTHCHHSSCEAMEPIQEDIMDALAQVDVEILRQPTHSVKNIYDSNIYIYSLV